MKLSNFGRPSPALVIAALALFAALGGGAYASQKIGTKDLRNGAVSAKKLKNGAVTTKKIRNNAVTARKLRRNSVAAGKLRNGAVRTPKLADGAVASSKIADGAVTGQKVNESTLGPVPSVEGFDRIALRIVQPSATNASQVAGRAAATPIALLSKGPLTIYAKCFKSIGDPTNPGVHGEVYLETSVGGVVYDSDSDGSGNGFIGPGTAESDRRLNDTSSFAGPGNPGTLNITDAERSAFWAAHTGGFVEGNIFVGSKVGSPPAGDGLFGSGDRCLFGGTVRSG